MRRALIHTSAPVAAQVRAGRTVSREFAREGLPHTGKTPQDDRRPRAEVRERSPSFKPSAHSSSFAESRSKFPNETRYNEAYNATGRHKPEFNEGPSFRNDRNGRNSSQYSTSPPPVRRAVDSAPWKTRGSSKKYSAPINKQSSPVQRRASLPPSSHYLPTSTPRLRTGKQVAVNKHEEDNDMEINIEGQSEDALSIYYTTAEAAESEFDHPLHPITAASPEATDDPSISRARTEKKEGFETKQLLPGFVDSIHEMLGPGAEPTPIQQLALTHCLPRDSAQLPSSAGEPVLGAPEGWRQFLLASETGSGKSIAYLLPMLQGIKQSELNESKKPPPELTPEQLAHQRLYNPRGLILAPTHELARQLTSTAKSLLHSVKLRVVCTSRANGATPLAKPAKEKDRGVGGTASKMAGALANMMGSPGGALDVQRSPGHKADVLVGTPMKLLDMVWGRGWDRAEQEVKHGDKGVYEELKIRRGRDRVVHFGTWRAKKELGLERVEWVVVDEADVLFDPDFQETTRMLLADISAARGHPLPPSATTKIPTPLTLAPSPRSLSKPMDAPVSTSPESSPSDATKPTPINYPFNFLLTSATIPKSLAAYLAAYHPSLVRLASPRLHRLPSSLQTEYVSWSGGRKEADVLRRVRRVWAEDAASAHATDTEGTALAKRRASAEGRTPASPATPGLSRVLIFCNRSTKVVDLAKYLEEQGVKCVALTSRSEERGRGSNNHLITFLRPKPGRKGRQNDGTEFTESGELAALDKATPGLGDPQKQPHVLITTSLLSRGLDFSPEIRHVFIVDEPRNTVDFLHRAGRTGRAGAWGKVVVFGKMSGRGAARGREVRKRVGALAR